MTTRRLVPTVFALGLLVSACSDQAAAPFTPDPTPAFLEVTSTPVIALPLKRLKPLPNNITRSITIQETGGAIRIPEAGFHLNIPKTAVVGKGKITITVTAIAGDLTAYEFFPHGMVFNVPIKFTQDLEMTTWAAHEGNSKLEGAYFESVDQIDFASGQANVKEFIPVVFASGDRLHFDIRHFSGYLVSMGRVRQLSEGF